MTPEENFEMTCTTIWQNNLLTWLEKELMLGGISMLLAGQAEEAHDAKFLCTICEERRKMDGYYH